jgi:hypothetical protein
MTLTSLAVPSPARPKRSDGRSSWPPVLGVSLSIYGVGTVAFAIARLVGAWPKVGSAIVFCESLAVALVWLGVANAMWRASPPTVRRSVGLALLLTGGIQAFRVVHDAPAEAWWISLALALVFVLSRIGVGIGVWYAREWSRMGCTILALALVAYHLATGAVTFGLTPVRVQSTPSATSAGSMILSLVPLIVLAIYGILPSTRQQFAEARETMSRADHVPE